MRAERRLRSVPTHPGDDSAPPTQNETGDLSVSLPDCLGSHFLMLLAGYVKGGCNNHDILMRAVGVAEAHDIAAGVPLDGERISERVDTVLKQLQQMPDAVLVRVQETSSLIEQMELIAEFLRPR